MKVSPGAQGPGARKGHVTGAESQQEKGGDVWLRAVLGRGRGGGLRMRPTPGRYARQARCIRSSKPGLERGARVSGQSALGLGSLVSCSRVSGGPSETHVPLGRPWGCQGGGVAAGAGAGCSYFVEHFYICVYQLYGPVIFCDIFIWFWYQSDTK